ncbi:MAG: restriction endonuclease subunit S [Anaerolineae bacterium]
MADIKMGQSPNSQYYNLEGVGYPFLQGCAQFGKTYPRTSIFCSMPMRLAPRGAILYSVRAPVGEINVADQDYCIGRGLAAVEAKSVDSRLLYYLLLYTRRQLTRIAQGSTFEAISSADLAECVIPDLGDLSTQTAIADILATVDRAIEQTEALIAKQRRIKAGLLHDLLTRGINEQGQLRDPATHRFKESALGLIPEEWEVSSVLAQFEIATGFTLGQHRRPKNNKRKYLRVANVQREKIRLDDIAELEAQDPEMAGRTLREDDLLVVEGHASPDEIGRCARVTSEAAGLTFQNHLFRLRSLSLVARFSLAWLNSEWVRGYWRQLCGTSSGLNTINQTMLSALPMPVPKVNEQLAISAMLDIEDTTMSVVQSQNEKLHRLKIGLMQDLLSGRVSVAGMADSEGRID